MDWQTLFLSNQGRINRRDFWLGFAAIFAASLVLGVIPLVGQVAGLLLIWPQICIHSKRLHDMGRSAWLQLIPFGVTAVCAVVAVVLAGAAIFGAMSASSSSGGGRSSALGGMSLAAMGGVGICIGVALLCGLGFLLWVGLSASQPGPNRYGPPTGAATDVPAE